MNTSAAAVAGADTQARTRVRRIVQQQVRVRLLIAIPVLIVLLLTVMGGVSYYLVEGEFRASADALSAARLQEFAQNWLIMLILFDLAGAAVGAYIAHNITSPIRNLIEVSERVAGGDFTRKTAFVRSDEMGQLGQTFDHMVDSLNNFITARNRFILESFSGGLITMDLTGSITAINSAAERMLHVQSADVTGRTARSVLNHSNMAQLLAFIEEALWKKRPIMGRNIAIQAGERHYVLSANSSVMKDPSGDVFGILINFRDMSELRKFYEQMNRADRLATIGTFATGLAHEIRNPLGAIKGTAQLLAEDVKSNPHALEYIKVIVKEVNRLDGLVREVQEFSTPAATPRKWLDLSRLVRETLALARRNPKTERPTEITVLEKYAELPRTYLSGDKITQALLNIMINAFQATPDHGEISVETAYLQDEPLPFHISITNTGQEIPPETIAKIFEPFYTTKDYGTGLGLSIAYQIITHHGGDIQVKNCDETVTFMVRLPLQHPEDEVTL